MPIEFRCSQCGQLLRVAETSAGKSARCPGCKAIMVVPAAGDLAARSLTPLSPPAPAPVPVPQPPAPQPPAPGGAPPQAASPPAPAQQDALFEYLKQATTPVGSQPGYPPPAQAPQPFAETAAKSPFGDRPQPASANPYASPASAAYSPYGQPPQDDRPGLPWEVSGGSLATWWETSQLCLGDAERAFRQMRLNGGLASPMLYALVGQVIGFLGQLVWSVPGMALQAAAGQGQGNNVMEVVGGLILQGVGVLVGATVGLLIGAAITHLCLLLVGGAKYGYETTYRVTAFTAGSVAWLNVIPCFGPLIYVVMWFVCLIQGLAQAHETSGGRAAAAAFLPLVACCLVCGAGIAAVIAIVAANQ